MFGSLQSENIAGGTKCYTYDYNGNQLTMTDATGTTTVTYDQKNSSMYSGQLILQIVAIKLVFA